MLGVGLKPRSLHPDLSSKGVEILDRSIGGHVTPALTMAPSRWLDHGDGVSPQGINENGHQQARQVNRTIGAVLSRDATIGRKVISPRAVQ